LKIPFTKAHGNGNDFLLTWSSDAPQRELAGSARAICDRHTGIGADGWIIIDGFSIRLFNADGTEAEISGNGTRCAAALLIDSGRAQTDVDITTGAGTKHLHLIKRDAETFLFEMNMGNPQWRDDQVLYTLDGREVTILDVGNPQCALLGDEIPANWREIGAHFEGHPFFPKRTNVSFIRVLDPHTIEARFYERGAGATLSSGTGSTGAAVAAILRKAVQSPVKVIGEAGELQIAWDGDSAMLTGPAVLIGSGEFYAA